jgi:hypothetical protein
MFRSRPGRVLLAALFLLATAYVYVFFALYILFGLIALDVLFAVLAPIAKGRGWGSEGRIARHLSRPRFRDESRRTDQDSAKPAG